ncbi:MAG: hypothetical protein ACETWM_17100 [Candidatus Lokiarchaeia archaeon]
MKERTDSTDLKAIFTVFLACGIVSYLIGLFTGFLNLLGGFLFPVVLDSSIIYVIPSWFIAFYSNFSQVYLPGFIIPNFGLSPISLWFLAVGGLAIALTSFGRLLEGSLFSFSALILAIVQFLIISSITGSEPIGTGLIIFATNPIGVPPYTFMFFEKNIIALVASIIFFGIIMTIYPRYQYLKAISQIRTIEAPSMDHFKIIKATRIKYGISILPLFIIPFAMIYDWLLVRIEFPNYHPFLGLLNWDHPTLFNGLYSLFLLFFFVIFAFHVVNYLNKFLAKSYTPLIERALEDSPILQFEEIKKILKVEKLSRSYFKALLEKVYPEAEKRGTPIGLYKSYLYAKKPLAQIAEKEIKKEGRADIYKIASEIFIHPEILTEIYAFLTFEGAVKNAEVTREGFIIKTQEVRFGRHRT